MSGTTFSNNILNLLRPGLNGIVETARNESPTCLKIFTINSSIGIWVF